MKREEILLGNGAIALGLLEAGCQVRHLLSRHSELGNPAGGHSPGQIGKPEHLRGVVHQ